MGGGGHKKQINVVRDNLKKIAVSCDTSPVEDLGDYSNTRNAVKTVDI